MIEVHSGGYLVVAESQAYAPTTSRGKGHSKNESRKRDCK
jgi:hypothetical protein